MYLLNRISSLISSCAIKFTFHYVSIKSGILCTAQRFKFDLHSTMYLLNPVAPTNHYYHLFSFTFHYVSIKSKYQIRSLALLQIHLHSTMYLLNRDSISRFSRTDLHLHSTMYLLNLDDSPGMNVKFRIYIPLCIY